MKLNILMMLMVAGVMAACGDNRTPEEKIQAKIAEAGYYLNGEDMARARANGRAYFEKLWPAGTDETGALKMQKGFFNECRPSDSNTNGKVTCSGILPNKNTGLVNVDSSVYCGYSKDVLGCSDQDN